MTLSNEEILRNLQSRDIDDLVQALDYVVEAESLFMEKSLCSLRDNVEWRPFIAERIYKAIQKQKAVIASFYEQESDNGLRFWLSTLILEFEGNTRFRSTLLDYIRTHEDGEEMLALNILIRKGVTDVGEIISYKLEELEFNINTFDRINFYFDCLKRLGMSPSPIVVKKAEEYNNSVEFEWEKLTY